MLTHELLSGRKELYNKNSTVSAMYSKVSNAGLMMIYFKWIARICQVKVCCEKTIVELFWLKSSAKIQKVSPTNIITN